jgi:HCOMODA/2-hydroxy-3-carboxy-muconic semialdehyde decarboxylase
VVETRRRPRGPPVAALADLLEDLVIANRILAREGIVDAFGHASVRCEDDPDRFVISRSLAPLQVTLGDLQHLDLDGKVVGTDTRPSYAEVAIHSEMYRARPDVNAVVHFHSASVIPYGVMARPLRPIFHMASLIGVEVPVWDIREDFGETDMLVHTAEQGASLARALGQASAVLMRGHGAAVVGSTLPIAVFTAYYLEQNAGLQARAEALGEVRFLNAGETARARELLLQPLALTRAWDYFRHRATIVQEG